MHFLINLLIIYIYRDLNVFIFKYIYIICENNNNFFLKKEKIFFKFLKI